jgi:PAS domain S-box-containing protein
VSTSESDGETRRSMRSSLRFRPGEMPPLFGDTAAALIVDDDAQLARVLARLLGKVGYECTLAANSAEARRCLSERRFALALIDVMMPGESGLELVEDMLAAHPDLAVVMVTGVDDPVLAELALESGAYGYVVKPFSPSQVLITVENASRLRCLEIERRVHLEQLERRLGEQEADLDEALTLLKEPHHMEVATFVGEEKYRGLVETAPDAVIAVDRDGRIVLVNAQAERLLGYDRAELVGQPVELLVPEHARDRHPDLRNLYMGDPHSRPMGAGMELAARRQDGTEFPAEISLSALITDEGILVSAAVRDVTDRKRADAKFRGLLEAAPDAIVGVDPDGRIALVNAQTERLFGYTREELIGQPVEILVPDAAQAVHPDRRNSYFQDPRPRAMGADMQLAGRRKDGTEFPAEISLNALETEDGWLVSAAVRDVSERLEAQAERERLKAQTEQERLKRQLHQSQRLESLGQLAGGVAHDFNNLLAVILNYAAFIREEVSDAANSEGGERWQAVREDVAQVQRAAERATQLTHQLLAFGRREIVQPEVLDLNAVVRDVEQLLRRSIGAHVQLVISLAPELWEVFADPGQIEQVLLNLAVNARDAMPGGGKLTIDTANVTVDEGHATLRPALTPGRHVRIRVSDNGQGMRQDVLERAFEPFFTTKPKGEGSGLGLATVYGIISQAGGYAQIYSEPGLGTTFTALLPATEDVRPQVDKPAERAHGRSSETVLVVEDEDAMREVTRRILSRNGHTVLVAASGEEAISIAAGHQGDIDLLLTDVIMPHMLGMEVAERITAIRPAIRVLYMSGYAQPVLASHGTLAEGVSLIEKPFSAIELLTKTRDILDA